MARTVGSMKVGEIRRGPGRPRKVSIEKEFVTLSLGEEMVNGQLNCEWVRVGDGARMLISVSETASAISLVNAFLGGREATLRSGGGR